MRLPLILALLSALFFISCEAPKTEKPLPKIVIEDFEFPGISIRALEVINDSTLWFAGAKGTWGYTLNNGKNWHIDTLKIPGTIPELRSIKVTPNGNVFLVNIINPAGVYRSTNQGVSWQKVYTDTSENAFFDAVNFWDDNSGILLGDANNHCFHFAVTHDQGSTWKKIPCPTLPPVLNDENPFAASNTNIAISGNSVWMGTGGKSASRVFHSSNLGESWNVTSTPIIYGEQMTGIYSIDFFDEQIGVVAGGNWDSVTLDCSNLAITHDAGKTWASLPNTGNAGFISCIQWVPNSHGNYLFTLSGRARGGKGSMALFDSSIEKWIAFENDKNYLSVKFANKNTAWVSGNGYIGKMRITY